MSEQLEMGLYIPREIDLLDCEDYCTSDDCMECVLCDRFKGEHADEIQSSAEKFKEMLRRVFR